MTTTKDTKDTKDTTTKDTKDTTTKDTTTKDTTTKDTTTKDTTTKDTTTKDATKLATQPTLPPNLLFDWIEIGRSVERALDETIKAGMSQSDRNTRILSVTKAHVARILIEKYIK